MIHKASEGIALIRHGVGGPQVSFGALIALPILHQVTEFDMSAQRFEMSYLEKNGLICRDGIKADVRLVFSVAPNQSVQDILRIDRSFGSEVSGSPEKLKGIFEAKFTEAAKICAREMEFAALFEDREKFRDAVVEKIGDDLHGFRIEDCAIDHLEQTAIEFLDPNNIIDAEGIKKITEITHAAQIKTNELNREMEKNEAIKRAQSNKNQQ